MTDRELASLKAQIKAELMAELNTGKYPTWDVVKRHIHERLQELDIYPYVNRGYDVYTSMNSIIRNVFNIHGVYRLKYEQIPSAIQLVDEIVDVISDAKRKHHQDEVACAVERR